LGVTNKMKSKKNKTLFAFDEDTNISKPTTKMFTLKTLFEEQIKDVAIYKKFEEAETELVEYLKKGVCCWIVSNNE